VKSNAINSRSSGDTFAYYQLWRLLSTSRQGISRACLEAAGKDACKILVAWARRKVCFAKEAMSVDRVANNPISTDLFGKAKSSAAGGRE
jgi:hypothetical protein